VGDGSRITELEDLVTRDPASIAFAQLAEDYRRLGQLEDAVRICREGLSRHHAFPSAQLTLARALLALGCEDEARVELHRIVRESPGNVAATRAAAVLGTLGEDVAPEPADERAAAELEAWLAAIVADRAVRAATPASS
jgi:predicted Zn-dependent protease